MLELKNHEHNDLFWITLRDGNVRLATLNADPGYQVYTERLIKIDEKEYRTFDPFKSKLAAAIRNNMKTYPFSKGCSILYLGAASGTTVSHVSDMIGENGTIYALEFSSRSVSDLINIAERRKNIIPIHADARFPEGYSFTVPMVDILYEDVAQPTQAEILNANIKAFLKKDGYFFIAVKARSIDVTKEPKQIYKEVEEQLKSFGLTILETIDLESFEKDHVMIVGQK